MILTPEFVAAEVAYRTQRITEDFRAVRRTRTLRSYLHLQPATRSEQLPAQWSQTRPVPQADDRRVAA